MKKLLLPLLLILMLPASFSCRTLRGYVLTEADAAAAIRQMLGLGAEQGATGAFSKDLILKTIFPSEAVKVINTLNQLGLTNEIDRFTTTLATASEKTAERSIPIFAKSISSLKFSDAIRIIKAGGTSATDYLRTSVGSELRVAITPVMKATLDEYKLYDQWDKIIRPVKSLVGDRVNLDLANLMAGLVSEAMFRKIEEKERQVRTDAGARTTKLLRQVFSRDWNS